MLIEDFYFEKGEQHGNKKNVTGTKTKTKKATKAKGSAKYDNGGSSIKKEFLKTKNVCKVTFRFPRIAAPEADTVCIVGEFNDWNIYANPMKKMKSGDFKITLELKPGKEYQFRYLINGEWWENDWNADKYVKSPFGDSDNSVVII